MHCNLQLEAAWRRASSHTSSAFHYDAHAKFEVWSWSTYPLSAAILYRYCWPQSYYPVHTMLVIAWSVLFSKNLSMSFVNQTTIWLLKKIINVFFLYFSTFSYIKSWQKITQRTIIIVFIWQIIACWTVDDERYSFLLPYFTANVLFSRCLNYTVIQKT